MSTLTSLARVEAAAAGRARPIATVRHVYVHQRPLVFIPLTLAGEANAPLAAMVGHDPDAPTLLVVAQPRNRDQRFAFAARLADIVLSYVDVFTGGGLEPVRVERGRDVRYRYLDAPQLIVPNTGGVGFVRLFGRSTRLRRTDGEWAVPSSVPLLGRWLTFFAERAEHPGSSLLLAATDALCRHWATGQSPVEDRNLAAVLGWIDPPDGCSGAQAAARAEDPIECPPAGPATDPGFDNEILDDLIAGGDVAKLEHALDGQLRPTWTLVWRAVDLLRGLPAGAHVGQRWAGDRDAFTAHAEGVREGRPPQPRRDSAVAAAARLDRLERAAASYAAQVAFDDPLAMAEYRLSGEAFAGTVTATQPERTVGEPRRKLRPLITVRTLDPLRLAPGTEVRSPARPRQTATIVERDGDLVVLELSGGMGRSLRPEPGTVPDVGEDICYSSIVDGHQPAPTFPAREETPWTHGGPPPEYQPSNEDATEEWS